MKLDILKIIRDEYLAKIFTTKGSTSRVDYLISMVFANLLYAIVSYFTNMWIDLILGIIHAFSLYTITIRRLHGVGKTWKSLIWMFTIIGIFYVVYLMIIKKDVFAQDPDDEMEDAQPLAYENERLHFIISILAIILVSFINSYSNNISAKSFYLNYPIITPIILDSFGVKSAEVKDMDGDGIVEAQINHFLFDPIEIKLLKDAIIHSHCNEEFYTGNRLFSYDNAKLVVNLMGEDSSKVVVIEINDNACNLIADVYNRRLIESEH